MWIYVHKFGVHVLFKDTLYSFNSKQKIFLQPVEIIKDISLHIQRLWYLAVVFISCWKYLTFSPAGDSSGRFSSLFCLPASLDSSWNTSRAAAMQFSEKKKKKNDGAIEKSESRCCTVPPGKRCEVTGELAHGSAVSIQRCFWRGLWKHSCLFVFLSNSRRI